MPRTGGASSGGTVVSGPLLSRSICSLACSSRAFFFGNPVPDFLTVLHVTGWLAYAVLALGAFVASFFVILCIVFPAVGLVTGLIIAVLAPDLLRRKAKPPKAPLP